MTRPAGTDSQPQPVQLPMERIRAIKRRSITTGTALIPASVVLGATGVVWAINLPVADGAFIVGVAGASAVAAFFLLFIGILAWSGAGCVKTGRLEVRSGRGLCRMALVFGIGAVAITGLGLFVSLLLATDPARNPGSEPGGFRPGNPPLRGIPAPEPVLVITTWTSMRRTLLA